MFISEFHSRDYLQIDETYEWFSIGTTVEGSSLEAIEKEVRFGLFKDDRTNFDTCQENSRGFLSLGQEKGRW